MSRVDGLLTKAQIKEYSSRSPLSFKVAQEERQLFLNEIHLLKGRIAELRSNISMYDAKIKDLARPNRKDMGYKGKR